MSLDYEQLPPELQDLHEELLADGADWRTELDRRTIGYEQEEWIPTRQTIVHEAKASPSAQPVRRSLRSLVLARPRNQRGLLAVAAMLAVVVLLGTLFHALAAGRLQVVAQKKTPTPLPTQVAVTATPDTTPQWQIVSIPAGQSAIFAPSDPRIMYSVQSSPPLGIQRSTDEGATWQSLPLPFQVPAGSNSDGWGFDQFVINPINPQMIYMEAAINSAALCASFGQSTVGVTPANPALTLRPSQSGEMTNLTPHEQRSDGNNGCSVQFYSADGGQRWQVLSLPVQGQLALYAHAANYVQSQGSRIYSTVTPQGPATGLQPLGRLVSSDDGIHWTTSDDALIARGLGIDEYAPTPTGSTVFAIAEPVDANLYSIAGSQHPPATPQYQLWRTDDAGASWRYVGGVPNNAVSLLEAVMDGGKPLLYAIASFTNPSTASMLEFSSDGGVSWHAVPTNGIPATLDISLPVLGQLADGSILVLLTVKGGSPTTMTMNLAAGIHLFAWKPGQARWREVAPPLQVNGVNLLVIQPPNARGAQTLWAQVSDQLNLADQVQYVTLPGA